MATGVQTADNKDIGNKNSRTLLLTMVLAAAMIALSFASVPLYRLFCQVTGFGGTPKVDTTAVVPFGTSETGSDISALPIMTVRFDANTNPNLPWRFDAQETSVDVRVGESVTVYYEAENLADRPITGMATFNVAPTKVASNFVKVQCFCFEEQTLEPGEKVLMPVHFFIDPEILEESRLSDVNTITLSYTFFKSS